MRSQAISVSLPLPFDIRAYDSLNARVAAHLTTGHVLWPQWATAFNGVGYRLAEAVRSDRRFRSALSRADRVGEELALYSFVMAASSAIECLAYSLWVLASSQEPLTFPLSTDAERRLVNLQELVGRLRSAYTRRDELFKWTKGVLVDVNLRALDDWRDVAYHRGAVPRLVSLGTAGTGPKSLWRVDIHRGATGVAIDPALTRSMVVLVLRTAEAGVLQAHSYLTRHGFPP